MSNEELNKNRDFFFARPGANLVTSTPRQTAFFAYSLRRNQCCEEEILESSLVSHRSCRIELRSRILSFFESGSLSLSLSLERARGKEQIENNGLT